MNEIAQHKKTQIEERTEDLIVLGLDAERAIKRFLTLAKLTRMQVQKGCIEDVTCEELDRLIKAA